MYLSGFKLINVYTLFKACSKFKILMTVFGSKEPASYEKCLQSIIQG